MEIRFLGTHNAESHETKLVSFIIDGVLAVDAGSLASELEFPEQKEIRAVLLSHGHYDHIRDIPAFAFNNTHCTTKVFGTVQTLQILSSRFIDGVVYPKFTSDSSFLGKASIELVPAEPFQQQEVEGYKVTAVPVKHPLDAVGFEIISGDGKSVFYSGDTGPGLSAVWSSISPQLIIIDVTWPNSLEGAARDAGHLCPEMLGKELIEFRQVKGYLPEVSAIHLAPQFEPEIESEIGSLARELGVKISITHEGCKLII